MSVYTVDWVLERIQKYAEKENHGKAKLIVATSRLLEERIIDSLSFVNFLLFLEQEAGFHLDLFDFDIVDFETPAALSEALIAISRS